MNFALLPFYRLNASLNSKLTPKGWACFTGVNPSIIGGFSGLCAFMGVAATFLSATLVRQLGILKVTSHSCFMC